MVYTYSGFCFCMVMAFVDPRRIVYDQPHCNRNDEGESIGKTGESTDPVTRLKTAKRLHLDISFLGSFNQRRSVLRDGAAPFIVYGDCSPRTL
ncbi:hypothetical protein ABIC60_003740 [Phyllobacterium ifriqiyense]